MGSCVGMRVVIFTLKFDFHFTSLYFFLFHILWPFRLLSVLFFVVARMVSQ